MTCSRLRLTLVRFSMTCRILQMHRAAALKLPAGLKSGRRLGVDDGLKQLLVCGELYPAVLVGGVPLGCQKCLSPCSVHDEQSQKNGWRRKESVVRGKSE